MKRKVSIIVVCLVVLSMVSFSSDISKKLDLNFLGIEVNQVDTIVQGDEVYVNINELANLTNNEIELVGDNLKFIHKKNMISEGKTLGSTRSNPSKLGEVVVVKDKDFLKGEYELELTLIDMIRGEKAENIVMEGNSLNNRAEDGQEYILAQFRVKVIYSEDDNPIQMSHSKFDTLNTEGVEYEGFYSVAGLKNSISRDLYQGSTFEGWTYFLVDENDIAPKAVFNRRGDISAWFELTE